MLIEKLKQADNNIKKKYVHIEEGIWEFQTDYDNSEKSEESSKVS